MQPNTTPISKNTPSIVETHVESVNDTNNPNSNSLEQLDSIFQSVKRQVNNEEFVSCFRLIKHSL